jgi:hypothetical protein
MSDWNVNRRPTARELRALIGKHVAFRRFNWEHHPERFGIVREIRGKNVSIDERGATDWYWFGASGFSFATLRPAPEKD